MIINIVIQLLMFSVAITNAQNYCHQNCQDYFPGPEFSECLQAQVNGNITCGMPPIFIVFGVIFGIVFFIAIAGICIRCCMVAKIFSYDQNRGSNYTFNQNAHPQQPLYVGNPGPQGWGRSLGSVPSRQAFGSIHTVYNPNIQQHSSPYGSVGVAPTSIHSTNGNNNYGFQGSESDIQPPSYDQAVTGTPK